MDFDLDRFMKDMEAVIGRQGSEDTHSNEDIEEGSLCDSDMDFGKFYIRRWHRFIRLLYIFMGVSSLFKIVYSLRYLPVLMMHYLYM